MTSIASEVQWNYSALPPIQVEKLASSLEISECLASLLIRLGITDPEDAKRFLNPSLQDLSDPLELSNMQLAVDRVLQAIRNQESVLVLGDYDVDGVTSTTLLVAILKEFDLKARYVIPIRSEEGYGLTHSILERSLREGKPDLFIALDCGTNSKDEVDYLKNESVDVIIIDHHQSKDGLPEGAILVNPHANEEIGAPWQQMCTVGLVFKLYHALVKTLKKEGDPLAANIIVKDCLDVVAIGTVADMVPLTAENRIVTKYGLERIKTNTRPGLQALCKVAGLSGSQEIKPADIAFKLGPRINASGRLADASLPVNMLLGTDPNNCTQIAKVLDDMNRERQDIERMVLEDAKKMVETQELNKELAIVLYQEDWHSGVVGIVAGKLARDYHRPCIILGSEGDKIKGSGRSVSGVNLVQALQECKDYLEKWGGHPMAAGIGLKLENLDAFRQKFIIAVGNQTGNMLPEPSLDIAAWIVPQSLEARLLKELDMLHPFGINNPEPIFGIKDVCLSRDPEVFAEEHFRFQLPIPDAPSISGIAWKMADRVPPKSELIDMAVRFSWTYWNNRKFPQVQLIDWRFSQS